MQAHAIITLGGLASDDLVGVTTISLAPTDAQLSTVFSGVGNGITLSPWHAAGLANSGSICEDPPGVRDGGGFQYYGAYLRNPSGKKICALHSMN